MQKYLADENGLHFSHIILPSMKAVGTKNV